MSTAKTAPAKPIMAATDITRRERVADAVGMEAGELVAPRRDDPRGAMLRMIAAYLLLEGDRLPIAEVARIMGKPESWVRSAKDYIERRTNHYYAFRVRMEKMLAAYDALASSD